MKSSPAFKRLWGANLFSNLADGFGKTAFPLLAVTLTRDPVLISLIGALVMLPWLLFAVPIGTILDNVNKKNALALSNSLRAAIAAVLTISITTHHITIYLLLFLTFLVGILEVIADTSSQSLIPVIVNNQDLEKANSRFEMTYTVIQDFVGAPIGGLLYGVAIALPFVFNASGLAVAAVLCFLIPLPFVKKERVHEISRFDTFKSDLKLGMTFLWGHHALRRLVLTTTAIGFSFSFASSTMILFLVQDLQLNPKNFGFMTSAMGIFSLAGAYLAPKTAETIGRGKTLSLAMSISTACILLTGIAPNIWFFLIPSILTAFTMVHWNILLMATYQRLIPQEFYARVHGARRTLVWGSMPIASFIGGFVAKIDLRLPWYIGGTIAFGIALLSSKFIINIGDSVVKNEAR
jgi:MFS family permease